MNDTRLYRGVFLASLGTLLFEIALIRVLSFTIWYHFAYVVLSTALLGFGASGTLLAVRPDIGAKNLERTLTRASVAAALTGVGFIAFMSAVPFDPMTIFSKRSDFVAMIAYQVGATIPFFFAGIAISVALRASADRVDRLYFWDLVGAGTGCALAVGLMNLLTPPGALVVACASLALAGAVFSGFRASPLATALGVLLLAASPFARRVPFTPALSKHLSAHVRQQHMTPVYTHWSALFRLDVVQTNAAAWRFVAMNEWGLSPIYKGHLRPAWGYLNHDASAGAPIYDLHAGSMDFLDDHVLRTPYLVSNPQPKVLVIGVGGGRDVLTALRFDASHVTGVELDPATVTYIRDDMGSLSAGMFRGPRVDLVAGEGRHFVEASHEKYDIIQITGVDTLSAQASGAYVLAENYLYTTEAFDAYLDHLTPRGLLSIGSGEWNANEPQATGRMVMVARQTLLNRGITDPSRNIVSISSHTIQTATLVRLEPFAQAEVDAERVQAERCGFEPLLLPGQAANPTFHALMTAEGKERKALFERLPYVIQPVTDERPFFFRFFRWKDALSQQYYGAVHTSALGQLVLVLLLGTLTLLGATFILIPLVLFTRRGLVGGRKTVGILLYFLALGFGFMLLEISLMQRFVMYLGYPTYALSVVLFALLVSLGVGSYVSKRWVGREGFALPRALLAVATLVVLYKLLLPSFLTGTLGLAFPLRVALTVLLLSPLGVALGTFFPLGIRRAESIHPDLVPWAWGINGCASVTASVFAVIVAMEYGFVAVWLLALAIYAGGVAALLLLTGSGSATQSTS